METLASTLITRLELLLDTWKELYPNTPETIRTLEEAIEFIRRARTDAEIKKEMIKILAERPDLVNKFPGL